MTPKAYRSLLRPARHRRADQGRRKRPARRPERGGQGHVRHRGRAHRRRQPGLACNACAGDAHIVRRCRSCSTPARPSPARPICDEFFYSVAGMNAHYGTPANARAPGRIPGGSSSGSAAAVGGGRCATSRSAATPAARCASRPRSTGSTASGRRTAGSTHAASPTWRRLFDVAGLVRGDAGRVPQGRPGAARQRGRVPRRSSGWLCWKTPSRRPKSRSPTCCGPCSSS